MLYKEVSFLLRSKTSLKILEYLNTSDKPMTPLQISKKISVSRSNISANMGKLIERNFVKCLNPEDPKWRFYEITTKGKQVLEKTNEMKE